MGIIKTEDLVYEYIRRDENGNVEGINRAVDDVSLDIKQGDFIAILGHNGSGKSTLAKHMNAILCPTEGTVFVDGMDTKNEDDVWNIRQTAGMGVPEPGQPDYRSGCGRGCGLRTGEHGSADERNLGACGRESESGGHV